MTPFNIALAAGRKSANSYAGNSVILKFSDQCELMLRFLPTNSLAALFVLDFLRTEVLKV
jgi:hypothetical protein